VLGIVAEKQNLNVAMRQGCINGGKNQRKRMKGEKKEKEKKRTKTEKKPYIP
jgi:iron only hydrogenase large subunit-like protein